MRLFSKADENLLQQPLLQPCCVIPAGHIGCLQLDTAAVTVPLPLEAPCSDCKGGKGGPQTGSCNSGFSVVFSRGVSAPP